MAIYSFIAEEQAEPNCVWSISEMCRVLGVSRSGFCDWRGRPPSERALTDRQLAIEIEAIWVCSDGTYGSPRVHRWLRSTTVRSIPMPYGPSTVPPTMSAMIRRNSNSRVRSPLVVRLWPSMSPARGADQASSVTTLFAALVSQ